MHTLQAAMHIHWNFCLVSLQYCTIVSAYLMSAVTIYYCT